MPGGLVDGEVLGDAVLLGVVLGEFELGVLEPGLFTLGDAEGVAVESGVVVVVLGEVVVVVVPVCVLDVPISGLVVADPVALVPVCPGAVDACPAVPELVVADVPAVPVLCAINPAVAKW